MTLFSIVYLVALVVGSGTHVNDVGKELPGEQVLDEITEPSETDGSSRTLLTVDQDNTVKVFVARARKRGGADAFRLERLLGQRVDASGGMPLKALLRPNEIPVIARTVSLDRGLRLHIVVTWRLVRGYYGPYYSILAFTEDRDQRRVSLIYRDQDRAGELKKFLVQDVNHDGAVDVVDVGSDGRRDTITVRSIQKDGHIRVIQQLSGYLIRFDPDRWPDTDQPIVIEEQSSANCGRVQHDYVWSRVDGKYVPVR
jgi:hypothetical protein